MNSEERLHLKATNAHPAPSLANTEPDEQGEGYLLRETEQGGFEPRILEDHGDPPLGEQMAEEELRAFGGRDHDHTRRREPRRP